MKTTIILFFTAVFVITANAQKWPKQNSNHSSSNYANGNTLSVPDTLNISYDTSNLVLDGLGNEAVWQGITATPILKVVEGSISGPSDLSATMKAYWNDDSLYLFFNVNDSNLYNGSPTIYENDNVEVYLDMDNSRGTSYDSNDMQIRFNWGLSGITGENVPPGINFAFHTKETNDGYSLEIAIPFSKILFPYLGICGFDTQIADNDGTTNRHAVISWNSDVVQNWTNPSVNGEAKFLHFITPEYGLSIQDIITPDCGTDTSSITVTLYNFGSQPIDSFDISYKLNGILIPSIETSHQTILSGETVNYTFNAKADLSFDGEYTFEVFSKLPGGDDHTSDSSTKRIIIKGLSNKYPTWTTYTTCNGLPGNTVRYIIKDSKNNMWIGTQDNGVGKMDTAGNWSAFDTLDGLSNNNVIGLLEDKNGSIWACLDGDDGIVAKYDGSSWTTPNADNIHTLSAFQDSKGYIWFGTWGYGIRIYDVLKNTFTTFTHANSGIGSDITWGGVREDKDKNIWIATSNNNGQLGGTGGLSKYDGINWMVYNVSNSGMPSNDIICSLMDSKGNIWLGYSWFGYGVTKYDGKYWVNYDTYSGLVSYKIGNIFEDSKGNIWFCSEDGNGACKFDGKDWKIYNTANSGIISNFVRSTAEDAHGNIWFATDNGISVLTIKSTDVITDKNVNLFSLNAFPNPFDNDLDIEFSLASESDIELAAYDLNGRKLVTIINTSLPAGKQSLNWNASGLEAGIYYMQLRTSEGGVSTKMIVKH